MEEPSASTVCDSMPAQSSQGNNNAAAAMASEDSSVMEGEAKVESSTAELDASGCASKKRRRRRRRGGTNRRRYKPYLKMTWDERQALDAREERRAERVRRDRTKQGIPVAPYNTTQFLLQDRQARSEREDVDDILSHIRERQSRHRNRSNSVNSGEGSTLNSSPDHGDVSVGSSSSSEYGNYMEEEFNADFETAHAERLDSMTKTDLVRDYLDLERRLDIAQTQLCSVRSENQELKDELATLKEQMERVRQQLPSPQSILRADSHNENEVTCSTDPDKVAPTGESESAAEQQNEKHVTFVND